MSDDPHLGPQEGAERAPRWAHHDEELPVDPDLAPDDPGEPSAHHHPVPHVPRARQRAVLAAIGAGGFVGAWGRYELSLAWKATPGHVPWATLTINSSGAFLLGLILTVLVGRGTTTYVRPFVCVGVLGAWTTMSTFAVEADLLVRAGHVGAALFYVAVTVMAGVTLAWVGIAIGRTLMVGRAARWAWR